MMILWKRFIPCAVFGAVALSFSMAEDGPGEPALEPIDVERHEDGRIAAVGSLYILLVNVDNAADPEWLDKQRLEMRAYLGLPIRAVEKTVSPAEGNILDLAGETRSGLDEKVVAMVMLYKGKGDGLIVSPDAMWAVVNPAWVGNDSEQSPARLGRQIYRALGFLFGVPFTPDPHAVMKPVAAPEDLDSLSRNFFPGNLNLFQIQAAERGMKPLRMLSLRERRKLGLLPAKKEDRIGERKMLPEGQTAEP